MLITSVDIRDLRVIAHLQFCPGREINLIVGANGAGKTSILEAIYLAGRGRTFRHAEAGPMIREGASSSIVRLGLEDETTHRQSMLGVQREKKQMICRLNGEDVKRRSTLAEALPVQWIGSQPQLLLEMGPEMRRRFIDMGLFHVERSYFSAVSEFHRILRQRNAAVRQSDVDAVRLWNGPLADIAERIDGFRASFIRDLMNRAVSIIGDWGSGIDLGYRYRRGWSEKNPLLKQLISKVELDIRMGYTTLGPQRAELELLSEGTNAERRLSRGQQKLVVLALNFALMDGIQHVQGKTPVLLLDDLAAELDGPNRSRILAEIDARRCQAFLTAIDADTLPIDQTRTRVFHVEHGCLACSE